MLTEIQSLCSALLFQLSIHTWKMVPISFSSKVKESGSNYLQLNFHYPQDRWQRGVPPHPWQTELPAGPTQALLCCPPPRAG